MANHVDQLLGSDEVVTSSPASQSAIKKLVKRLGTDVPEMLLKIWRAGDKVEIEALDAHIVGPSEILQLIADGAWSDLFVQQGYVPVLDDHQSNYLAVIVRGPLAFRVVFLPHDDCERLLYRDLNGFAKALLDALAAGDPANLYFHETTGDYPPEGSRPREDQEAAIALLATDGQNGEWNYAIQLLDSSNLAQWARVLETDHFVRRDAVARMRGMKSPAIQELLGQDQLAFNAFARDTAQAARNAGLLVGEQRQTVLQIGGSWMELEGFFHRRNQPNATARMIAWFEDLIAGRNPYDRPDNFMTDRV